MKFLFLYLNFLICFSTLLDQVRIKVVDQTLLKLPKRGEIDILKMSLEMSNAKKEKSMNDAESAYLVYKWIGQNIEYDCLGNKFGNSTTLPATTYKEGKGGDVGISGLFNTICGFLNIESNTIFGIKKTVSRNYTNNLIDINEYAWNYISIDNKYYLLDVTSSVGSCSGIRFYRDQRDEYFGIDPELSIRHRFPNDKKWQLLPNPITENKFKLQAILNGNLTKYIKSITPDVQTIRNQRNMKITLTLKDPNITKLIILESDEIENELPLIGFDKEVSVVNGNCSIIVDPFGHGYIYIHISAKNGDKTEKYGSITFECIYDKNS